MCENDNTPLPDEEKQYSNSILHKSPVGSLVECIHIPSNETRGLKIVKPEFIKNHDFFTWYSATLTLAGQTAEEINRPQIISLIKTKENKWFTIKDHKIIVERPFIGTTENKAYNLNEFIEKYNVKIDEETSLSIMYLIVSVLDRMHNTRFESSDNVILDGIPHINLKPENIIIWTNPKNGLWELYLSDHLIAMASPIAEECGIIAPLNYSDINILQNNYYYNKSTDIFSCGLILYKLLESKDFIPPNMNRQNVINFINDDLSTELRNIRLTNAKKSQAIITNCLTKDKNQRYQNIKELKTEISLKLKLSRRGITISDILDKKLKDQPSPGPIPIPVIWKKIIIAISIIAVIVFGYFTVDFIRSMYQTKAYLKIYNDLNEQISNIDNYCLNTQTKSAYELDTQTLHKYIDTKDFKKAKLISNKLRSNLKTHKILCDSLKSFSDTINTIKNANITIPDDTILIRMDNVLDSAEYSLRESQFYNVRINFSYINDVFVYIDSVLNSKCDIEELRSEFQALINQLQGPCRLSGRQILEKAIVACSESNLEQITQYKSELISLIQNPNCIQNPENCESIKNDINIAKNNLDPSCQDEVALIISNAEQACEQGNLNRAIEALIQIQNYTCSNCIEERQMLERAANALESFKQTNDNKGIPYKNCTSYKKALDYFNNAEKALAENDCRALGWNAKTLKNHIEISMELCIHHLNEFKKLKNCLNENSDLKNRYSDDIESIWKMLDSCDCSNAGNAILNIKKFINCEQDTCTYQACEDAYKNGELNAWKNCDCVSPSDHLFGEAMKLKILSMGENGFYDPSYRPVYAVAAQYSTHGITDHPINAKVYITLTLAYGWDLNNIFYQQAQYYYDSAQGMAKTVLEINNWWQAELVNIRCKMIKWRSNKEEQLRIDINTIIIPQFLKYIDNLIIPNKEYYINEIRNYKNELYPELY